MIDVIRSWIRDHIPLTCPVCRRVLPRKDSVFVTHRVAGPVRMCKKCKKEKWL